MRHETTCSGLRSQVSCLRSQTGSGLRPQSIRAPIAIPLRCRLEEAAILGDEMLSDRVLVDLEAQPWAFRHRDVATLDDRLRHAVDEIAPERQLGEMVLQRDEVLGRRGAAQRA